ncbi:sigma-70 family RNA polymerase sigma factor [Dyadobacter sp. CY261]|uniref:RNA polymerase sigma factor n=1 Tax=Dyadobacter sp. CY261 TaxID=2907203 RepID=UPI001F3EA6E2|nr:sigma-70 family RNA polymerase sigma factor [Dyadobacter sp. CY261]MCF0071082.1 sigma-70 family RNA polymerase sigma factor [Dyadobacter sp. CY261]
MSLEKEFIKTVQVNTGIINSICRTYFPAADDFKDARQDVILQLWRSFPTFRGTSKISTWIYKVTLNTILTKRKNDQNLGAHEPISQTHLDELSFDLAPTADDKQIFAWLVGSLDDCDKAIVMLWAEGYGNKEIALMLDLSATNVSTRLNRLKCRLKDYYFHEHR